MGYCTIRWQIIVKEQFLHFPLLNLFIINFHPINRITQTQSPLWIMGCFNRMCVAWRLLLYTMKWNEYDRIRIESMYSIGIGMFLKRFSYISMSRKTYNFLYICGIHTSHIHTSLIGMVSYNLIEFRIYDENKNIGSTMWWRYWCESIFEGNSLNRIKGCFCDQNEFRSYSRLPPDQNTELCSTQFPYPT